MPHTLVSTYTFRTSPSCSGTGLFLLFRRAAILVQLHPSLQHRLDTLRGLQALHVRAVDVLLYLGTNLLERLLLQIALPRRLRPAANESEHRRRVVEDLIRGHVVKI